MTFADIPTGASVFIDANTFVYHFAPHPVFKAACGLLLLRSGIAQRLRKHPQAIQSLSRFRRAIDAVPQFGVQILVPPSAIVSKAAASSQQHGLLSGDALIVASMQHFGISAIASHDADFDRVPGLVRYQPVS